MCRYGVPSSMVIGMLILEAFKLFVSGCGGGHHTRSGIDRRACAAFGIGIEVTMGVAILDPEPLDVLQLFLARWGQLSQYALYALLRRAS